MFGYGAMVGRRSFNALCCYWLTRNVGRVLEHGTKDFENFISEHSIEILPATRSIIIVNIHQVGSSCGFSVPFFDFKEYRPVLNNHFEKKKKRYEEGKEDESMDQ